MSRHGKGSKKGLISSLKSKLCRISRGVGAVGCFGSFIGNTQRRTAVLRETKRSFLQIRSPELGYAAIKSYHVYSDDEFARADNLLFTRRGHLDISLGQQQTEREVDERAEEFIAKFREKLLIERKESEEEFWQKLARGT